VSRPRALHIAPIMPARAGNGLAMRQGMFLEALAREFDTELVVLPVAGPAEAPPSLPGELGVPATVIAVAGRADTHFSLLQRLVDPAARLTAFRAYGRSSLAAHVSTAVLAELRERTGPDHYDLIHIGRSYLADARSLFTAPATLDLDEDELTSYAEVAAQRRATDPMGAALAEAEGAAMSALIARSAPGFTRHFISSPVDATQLTERHPGLTLDVVENAITMPPRQATPPGATSLFFVGSFGYAPNVDAVTWFAGEIWPAIRQRAGRTLRFRIVGRDAARLPPQLGRDGIEIVGEVEDISAAYAEASMVVAPLRAGAGTRLKLLEAAAHGAPIVTTRLGNRGLPFAHGRDLLVADDAPAFAAAVLETLADLRTARVRATAARAIVSERYDRAAAIKRLACRFRDIAAR